MPQEGRELHVVISSKETYSILRDWNDKKIDFEEKTDVYSETRQIISHMGSPVQESCTPGSTGGAFREGHVYQPIEKTSRNPE